MKRNMVVGMLIVAAVIVTSDLAAEEKWPTRPITIYIGYAPGGGMDMLGRLMSEEMRKTLGTAMPVVNMSGANGAIAMDHVYKQPKDGYSLYGISSSQTTYPATGLSKLTYKEFGIIGIVFGFLPIFSVPWDSPLRTAQDLIEGLKKGGLTGSNSGIGAVYHFPQLILMNTIGGKFKAVPYDGGAPRQWPSQRRRLISGSVIYPKRSLLLMQRWSAPCFYMMTNHLTLKDSGSFHPLRILCLK